MDFDTLSYCKAPVESAIPISRPLLVRSNLFSSVKISRSCIFGIDILIDINGKIDLITETLKLFKDQNEVSIKLEISSEKSEKIAYRVICQIFKKTGRDKSPIEVFNNSTTYDSLYKPMSITDKKIEACAEKCSSANETQKRRFAT